jgi:DegV family protein with EDD domain
MFMAIQIVTDSAADLTPEEIRQYGIHVVPLRIQFPDVEIAASAITPDDFYDRLRAMVPQVPTTSQPSVGDFVAIYEPILAAGDEVLSIHISSGLSGTVATAGLATRELKSGRVTTVDTLSLSCGLRYQVLAAALAARKGWSVAQIGERLAAIRKYSEVVFTLETLEYLARGGRIGRVQALAGSLLSIKPVIRLEDDGKYGTLSRGRTLSQTLNTIGAHLASRYAQKPVWVTVMHGQFADKADALAADLRARLNVSRLDVLRISPVLGVHTGPGIVGAGVVPLELFSDLL